ncbi:Slx4p interacting protein [Serendipita sp. 399]|nr:Slx4p interacting protein [Serendipita sp. 399]
MSSDREPQSTPRYDQAPPNLSTAGSTRGGLTIDSQSRLENSSNKESLLSYRSAEDMAEFLRKMDGRNYNVLNDSYFLPSDETEWERLDKQHVAFIIGLKSLVPCPDVVKACLAPVPGVTRSILDLGCGTGVWALEMAREYPHATVVGVDLAPTPVDADQAPPNCRFEIDDVNMGLTHFYDSYDVVHVRLISSGIKDYRKMMEEAEKCLKPGGVVIFVDYDAQFCAEDQVSRQPMAESNENGSWLVRCSHEMRNGAPLRGSDIMGMEKNLDKGLWDHELCDPETLHKLAVFSFLLDLGHEAGVVLRRIYQLWLTSVIVPDAAKAQQMQFAGILIRQDYANVFRAVIPVFSRMGIPSDVVEEWKPRVEEELNSSKLHMWSRTRLAWARRREAPGKPAPPLPSVDILEEEGSKIVVQPALDPVDSKTGGPLRDYSFFHLYRTQEECIAAAKFRNESLGQVPVPWLPDCQYIRPENAFPFAEVLLEAMGITQLPTEVHLEIIQCLKPILPSFATSSGWTRPFSAERNWWDYDWKQQRDGIYNKGTDRLPLLSLSRPSLYAELNIMTETDHKFASKFGQHVQMLRIMFMRSSSRICQLLDVCTNMTTLAMVIDFNQLDDPYVLTDAIISRMASGKVLNLALSVSDVGGPSHGHSTGLVAVLLETMAQQGLSLGRNQNIHLAVLVSGLARRLTHSAWLMGTNLQKLGFASWLPPPNLVSLQIVDCVDLRMLQPGLDSTHLLPNWSQRDDALWKRCRPLEELHIEFMPKLYIHILGTIPARNVVLTNLQKGELHQLFVEDREIFPCMEVLRYDWRDDDPFADGPTRSKSHEILRSRKVIWEADAKPRYVLRALYVQIGSTPNPLRRLRQHNGEIQAGARRTAKGRPWEILALVHGFPSRLSALQFEWAWQHANKTRHLKDGNGQAVVSRTYTLQGRIHVKLFSLEALRAWNDARSGSPPLPKGFNVTLEPEGVDGTKPLTGSRTGRSGPIDITDGLFTAQHLSKADALRRSVASQHCTVCKSRIDLTKDDPMSIALCSTPSCRSVSHMTCLANQFLSQESSELMVPRGGQCAECRQWNLWGDIVKGAYRRKTGGITYVEIDQSSDDSDLEVELDDSENLMNATSKPTHSTHFKQN